MRTRKIIPESKAVESNFSLKDYFGKDVFEKAAELYEYVNRPMFKRKETGVSHRNLNWWASEDVLGMAAKEYSKFSFVELVWVKIIEQLRTFGVPLPLIAIYKKHLFETIKIDGLPSKRELLKKYLADLDIPAGEKNKLLETIKPEHNKKDSDTGVSYLQLLIMSAILKRKPLGIAFFYEGFYLIIDKQAEASYTDRKADLLNNGHYVRVSLSKILSGFLTSDLAFQYVPELRLLTLAENKLYEAIKTGEYESITVNFKERKIKALELKKSVSVQKRIIDVLNENKFSEIVVKKHNGIVTKIEQNIKIAF